MRKVASQQKRATIKHQLKRLVTARKAASLGIAALLLVLVTLISGIFFYSYVVKNIGAMQNNFNEQMELLFLKSFNINSTHIISFIGNKGIWAISIVSAYVNNQIANILRNVQIEKDSIEPVYILGAFTRGLTYTVKLVTNFGGSFSFDITYM